MKIALGSDHRGDRALLALNDRLAAAGHELLVFGEHDGESRDYPESAWAVGNAVATGQADRGILLCGSGIGMCMAANKVDSIRAALVHDLHGAEMSRRHNDANVICLSADALSDSEVDLVIDTWLTTEFEGGRHARRVAKIHAIEHGDNPAEVDITAKAHG